MAQSMIMDLQVLRKEPRFGAAAVGQLELIKPRALPY
jgi:hypothetical protein